MKPLRSGEKSEQFVHSHIELYLHCDECEHEETDYFFLKIDKDTGLMHALAEIEPRHCLVCAYQSEAYKPLTIGYIKLNQIGLHGIDIFQE